MKHDIITDKYGNKIYYLNNALHRNDGPAFEYADGTKCWYKNGLRHREDGPAIERANGTKCWYKNGDCHREDGPAVECSNGNKIWVLRHTEYGRDNDFTNESWQKFIKTIIFS